MTTSRNSLARIKGCFLGGAAGDALGAPVEFLSHKQIVAKYGREGIGTFDEAYGAVGAITDDTQMTLFTVEGLIQVRLLSAKDEVCTPAEVLASAYRRWLVTQGERPAADYDERGWLLSVNGLHARRAPGYTCLSALRTEVGPVAQNDSKGCGTVMRSAPFGFMPFAWELAWEAAEITHGHREAHASAALLARAIEHLVNGMSLQEALVTGL